MNSQLFAHPVLDMLDPLTPLPSPHPGLPVPHLPRVRVDHLVKRRLGWVWVDHQGCRLGHTPHPGQGGGDMVWVAAVHPNGHNPARFSQRVFQNRPHCILNGFPCTKVAAILDGEAHLIWHYHYCFWYCCSIVVLYSLSEERWLPSLMEKLTQAGRMTEDLARQSRAPRTFRCKLG